MLKVSGGDRSSIYPGLSNIWKKNNTALKRTRKHEASAKLLAKIIGERDYHTVTLVQLLDFRDKIEKELANAPNSQIKHIDHVRAMFTAAVLENEILEAQNPAASKAFVVRKHVRTLSKSRKAPGSERGYTAEQLVTIFKQAPAKLGSATFREGCLWQIKLMCWHGLQPNEACQLQHGDVYKVGKYVVLNIRETGVGMNDKHPQKSMKRDSRPRVLPLHPKCAGFFDYVQSVTSKDDDFVFAAFHWNADMGRASYLSGIFSKFLREHCGIVMPKNVKPLYGFRHRHKTAARRVAKSSHTDDRTYISGHGKSIEQRYGDVSSGIKYLAPKFANINPLAAD